MSGPTNTWQFWGAREKKPNGEGGGQQETKHETKQEEKTGVRSFWVQKQGLGTKAKEQTSPDSSPDKKESIAKQFELEKNQKLSNDASLKAKEAAQKAEALAEQLRAAKLARQLAQESKERETEAPRSHEAAQIVPKQIAKRVLQKLQGGPSELEDPKETQAPAAPVEPTAPPVVQENPAPAVPQEDPTLVAAKKRAEKFQKIDPERARTEAVVPLKFTMSARMGVLDLDSPGRRCTQYGRFQMRMVSPKGDFTGKTAITLFVCPDIVYLAFETKPAEYLLMHPPCPRKEVRARKAEGAQYPGSKYFHIALRVDGRTEEYTLQTSGFLECQTWLSLLAAP